VFPFRNKRPKCLALSWQGGRNRFYLYPVDMHCNTFLPYLHFQLNFFEEEQNKQQWYLPNPMVWSKLTSLLDGLTWLRRAAGSAVWANIYRDPWPITERTSLAFHMKLVETLGFPNFLVPGRILKKWMKFKWWQLFHYIHVLYISLYWCDSAWGRPQSARFQYDCFSLIVFYIQYIHAPYSHWVFANKSGLGCSKER
jgi:hypothetical protein